MSTPSSDMDRSIARCRVFLSVVVCLVLYVDPLTGGAFALDRYWATVLAAHLVYSLAILAFQRRIPLRRVPMVGDVVFVAAVATVTEGTTSPFYVFFAFAVLTAGLRSGLTAALVVTTASVVLYVTAVMALSPRDQHLFLFMRVAYIAIAGYLVGFFGESVFARRYAS